LGVTGCGPTGPIPGKMDGKMGGEKMDGGKMGKDKMGGEKMESGKMDKDSK
jgi:hypothetical protein